MFMLLMVTKFSFVLFFRYTYNAFIVEFFYVTVSLLFMFLFFHSDYRVDDPHEKRCSDGERHGALAG